jgi:16S rRNA (guanine527-N7)-methyltransferase
MMPSALLQQPEQTPDGRLSGGQTVNGQEYNEGAVSGQGPNRQGHSCSLNEQQLQLLESHLDYVLEQNQNLNLTAIREKERARIVHVEDSLTAVPELEAAPHGAMVDMGSGAGFPGIPLSVVTGRRCVLVEATTKKAQMLKGFIQAQGLEEQIAVQSLRVEELARQEGGIYAVATARALSSLPSLMELAAPLLQESGVLIAYKGRLEFEEVERARALEGVFGMKLTDIRGLMLSDKTSMRTLVSIQKTAQPSRPLPRRNGQAQRHPLA